jgi:hypothetical protein
VKRFLSRNFTSKGGGEVVISEHARMRIKERVGKKIDPERFVELAQERGLKHNECKGNLRKWVDSRVLYYGRRLRPLVYSNHLLLVSGGDVLVTVLDVPASLHDLVAKLQQRKRSERG